MENLCWLKSWSYTKPRCFIISIPFSSFAQSANLFCHLCNSQIISAFIHIFPQRPLSSGFPDEIIKCKLQNECFFKFAIALICLVQGSFKVTKIQMYFSIGISLSLSQSLSLRRSQSLSQSHSPSLSFSLSLSLSLSCSLSLSLSNVNEYLSNSASC
jgi:hypothetical protein